MSDSKKTPAPLVLDVRPLLAQGVAPCEPIDTAIDQLQPGQILVLLAPFEPVPLFAKLGRLGFAHQKEHLPDGTWRIEFRKAATAAASTVAPSAETSGGGGDEIHLDNRGLEPPEPLVRTLEALVRLERGRKLTMLSDRKPLHLFAELDKRGFAFDCTEQVDHSFVTVIWQAERPS